MSREVRIRLKYSSIINYLAITYRMLVAIGFTVIVARRLSISEFGLLGIILSSISMLYVFTGLWTYWTQRFLSRGVTNSFGTGLALTLMYSTCATLIYLIIGLVINKIVSNGLFFFILSIPFLWLNILNTFMSSVSAVMKPELIGMRGFIYETLRLVLAYILVVNLNLGLCGAIASLELALLIALTYMSYSLKHLRFNWLKHDWDLAKEWFKGFSIPLTIIIYSFLNGGVRVFASLVGGSGVPVAYLNVGYSAYSPIISAATSATPALYAKVLRRGRGGDVEEVLRIFILINSLLLSVFIALSRTIASLYNPKYVDAWVVIVMLSLYAFIEGLRSIFYVVTIGSSRVDVEGIKSTRELIRSELFIAPLIRIVGMVISYGVGVVLALTLFLDNYLMQAVGFTLGLFLGALITLPWFMIKALNSIKFNIPWKEVLTGLASAVIITTYILYFKLNNILITSFWHDIIRLAPHAVAVLTIYIIVWYALSPWFRNLAKTSLRYTLKVIHINLE